MATVASPAKPRSTVRVPGIAHVADTAGYWLIIAGLYLTYGFQWYYAAKEKLFDQSGTMPPPLAKAFHGSFIASLPGVNTAWLLLGMLEFVVFLAFAASLASGEVLPARRKPILLSALGLSIFAYGVMAFAENMVGNFSTAAELFGYLTGTAIVIILVLMMPPYRKRAWLSGIGQRDAES